MSRPAPPLVVTVGDLTVDLAVAAPALARGGAGELLLATAMTGTLLANLDEAATLTGRRDPQAAAGRLAARVGTAVVKCGDRGVVAGAGAGARPLAVAAPRAEVVDVTGAGDAFAAGYLVALAGGADPAESARAGALLAARAVAVDGAWPPLPTVATPRYP